MIDCNEKSLNKIFALHIEIVVNQYSTQFNNNNNNNIMVLHTYYDYKRESSSTFNLMLHQNK